MILPWQRHSHSRPVMTGQPKGVHSASMKQFTQYFLLDFLCTACTQPQRTTPQGHITFVTSCLTTMMQYLSLMGSALPSHNVVPHPMDNTSLNCFPTHNACTIPLGQLMVEGNVPSNTARVLTTRVLPSNTASVVCALIWLSIQPSQYNHAVARQQLFHCLLITFPLPLVTCMAIFIMVLPFHCHCCPLFNRVDTVLKQCLFH